MMLAHACVYPALSSLSFLNLWVWIKKEKLGVIISQMFFLSPPTHIHVLDHLLLSDRLLSLRVTFSCFLPVHGFMIICWTCEGYYCWMWNSSYTVYATLLSVWILLPSFKECCILFCQTVKLLVDPFSHLEACLKASLGQLNCGLLLGSDKSCDSGVTFWCLYWMPRCVMESLHWLVRMQAPASPEWPLGMLHSRLLLVLYLWGLTLHICSLVSSQRVRQTPV